MKGESSAQKLWVWISAPPFNECVICRGQHTHLCAERRVFTVWREEDVHSVWREEGIPHSVCREEGIPHSVCREEGVHSVCRDEDVHCVQRGGYLFCVRRRVSFCVQRGGCSIWRKRRIALCTVWNSACSEETLHWQVTLWWKGDCKLICLFPTSDYELFENRMWYAFTIGTLNAFMVLEKLLKYSLYLCCDCILKMQV